MTRTDGRSYDALRPVSIETSVQRNPEGSVLYRCGGTTVLIAASVSEGVPDWIGPAIWTSSGPDGRTEAGLYPVCLEPDDARCATEVATR